MEPANVTILGLAGEEEDLLYGGVSHDAHNLAAIPELTDIMRSRRHQLHLCRTPALACSADDCPEKVGPCDSDSAHDRRDDAQRGHGKDDVVVPVHRLAHELLGDLFAKQGYQRREIRDEGIGEFLGGVIGR